MGSSIQTLRDQNQLLRSSNNPPIPSATIANGEAAPSNPTEEHQGINDEDKKTLREAEETKMKLEKEIRLRDEIIMELEMRLQSDPAMAGTNAKSQTESTSLEEQQRIEGAMLHSQIQTLYATVATKDEEIDR